MQRLDLKSAPVARLGDTLRHEVESALSAQLAVTARRPMPRHSKNAYLAWLDNFKWRPVKVAVMTVVVAAIKPRQHKRTASTVLQERTVLRLGPKSLATRAAWIVQQAHTKTLPDRENAKAAQALETAL